MMIMIMVAMKLVIIDDDGDKRSAHAVSTIWPAHLLNATKLSYRLDFSFTIVIDIIVTVINFITSSIIIDVKLIWTFLTDIKQVPFPRGLPVQMRLPPPPILGGFACSVEIKTKR